MNKADLVAKIAENLDVSKAEAARYLDATVGAITAGLQAGDVVSLVGFGTFSVKDRAARMGRNPRTGEQIQIPASRVPGFKASKTLKDSVQ